MPQPLETVRILAIQHQPEAGLGRFGDWLAAAGAHITTARPDTGDELPSPHEFAALYDALIVLGGAAGAHDDADNPWFPAVKELLRASAAGHFPSFNICLGGQLLAVAAGGDIRRKPAPSYGVFPITAAAPAVDDPVFADFAASGDQTDTVLFHQDEITLPEAGVQLFTGADSPVQAFRVGACAWGTQFHPEATAAEVSDWLENTEVSQEAGAKITAGIRAADNEIERSHRLLAESFVRVCRRHRAEHTR